tara:strand:+ start:265 stop:534 length:270 start_codon:yes stop_codon:yes gene_type:complete
MKISDVLIEDKIKEKILNKHNLRASEIKNTLLNSPYILKSGKNRYMAIGISKRIITIIFEIHNNIAFIITAYPSSEAQRKLYKLKRKPK